MLVKLSARKVWQDNCNGRTAYWLRTNRHKDGRSTTQALIRNRRGYLSVCYYALQNVSFRNRRYKKLIRAILQLNLGEVGRYDK
ncbi:hypothetical protein QEG73_01290 [Chitinophagaceae bacterium 26-R-25]|nr:hypothetical protein [Chitinophagaceae bacterium 26-R-25]